MKLLFDIGNTRIKWAHYLDDQVYSSASINAANSDLAVLQSNFENSPKPDSVWVSNVGSAEALSIVTGWTRSAFKLEPNVIKVSKACCGVKNNYQTQDTLGVDRWLAAVNT